MSPSTSFGTSQASLGLCLVVALMALVASGAQAPRPDARPNILLIVADDLGYADLGAYGGDIRTPRIDALAAEGILFTQFHTAPLCAPTRPCCSPGTTITSRAWGG